MVGHTKNIVEVKKNKKKEEVSSDELLANIIGEPSLDGFRKGITKKDVIKSLSKEDWVRLDKEKAADDKKNENEIAYKAFIMNDQLRKEFESTKIDIADSMATALMYSEGMMKNTIDITGGDTDQTDNQGKKFTITDLKHQNMKFGVNIMKSKMIITAQLNKLYTFVNRQGLDRKTFFSEEEYDKLAKDAIHQFATTGYKLL